MGGKWNESEIFSARETGFRDEITIERAHRVEKKWIQKEGPW